MRWLNTPWSTYDKHKVKLVKQIFQKNSGTFHYNKLALQSELDNEFDLVFIVGYQNFLQLTYIDKLLSEVKKRFRDMYKNRLEERLRKSDTRFDFFYLGWNCWSCWNQFWRVRFTFQENSSSSRVWFEECSTEKAQIFSAVWKKQ